MFRVSSSEKWLTVNIRSSRGSTVGQFKANDTSTIKEKVDNEFERKYECVCVCGREGTGIWEGLGTEMLIIIFYKKDEKQYDGIKVLKYHCGDILFVL